VGIKTHMGYNQEACDAGTLPLLDFGDCFEKIGDSATSHDSHRRAAAIRRMDSEEPGPGQMYALRERRTLRCYGGQGRTSPPRSGEARRTRKPQGLSWPTNGRNLRRRNQTPAGWVAGLLGTDGGARDAAPQIPGTPEAGGLGEK